MKKIWVTSTCFFISLTFPIAVQEFHPPNKAYEFPVMKLELLGNRLNFEDGAVVIFLRVRLDRMEIRRELMSEKGCDVCVLSYSPNDIPSLAVVRGQKHAWLVCETKNDVMSPFCRVPLL